MIQIKRWPIILCMVILILAMTQNGLAQESPFENGQFWENGDCFCITEYGLHRYQGGEGAPYSRSG